MSSPRYRWWAYAKAMVRAYPSLKREYDDLHTQSVTAAASGMPGSSAPTRGTEEIAIRELPSTRQREYEAVRRAVEATARMRNGVERLRIIELVYWKHSHTLAGAGLTVGYGYDRAKQIHREFILTVAAAYGLLDKEET